MRLGVVEDHARVRESLVELFEAYGFEVVGSCANGHEAVAFCLDAEPDAIVMDVRMPVLDGIAATREIKRLRPEIRVILLTAYDENDLRAAAADAGADNFLAKGTPGIELVEQIRQWDRCPSARA